MKEQSNDKEQQEAVRPFARNVARELNQKEIDEVAGGGIKHTNYTGARGDAPSDSGGNG